MPDTKRLAERVTYKAKTHTGEEIFVLANTGMTLKYRKNTSIPVAEVVQSFHIYTFHNNVPTQPSKQELQYFIH